MICRIASILTFALVCSAPASAEDLMLAVEHAQVIRLPGDASTVIVGNPSIADALVHDGRTLVLTGRLQGRTNVIAMDRIGRVIYSSEIAVTNPVPGQVALFRGPDRTTMSCAETCDEVPRVGDDPTRVTWLDNQQAARLATAQSAIDDPS
ncbi:pilus assembly protein N-terminal domain-containing protein [uncultured Maricaulis sp.]|uniref:pilus assembly protein N-terminal domain-containing protein n=1 Tax=uncultured Maricaulis sp. TaxID=174710 RepID=UPI0030DBFACF|tara:strand:- start:238970 stop:239422 length:453 start_codon:yes stop_codon:yes gene_type:complete